MRMSDLIFASTLIAGLTGCATTDGISGFSYRNGPSYVIDPAEIDKSTQNQIHIMEKLEVLASNGSGKFSYYDVTVTGFNFVDEQCDAYLHELYALDHERDRWKSAINATGVLSNAILGAMPVSKASITIVAQAFGLSSSLVDSFTDSYTFKSHSADVYTIVGKLQAEYRTQTKTFKTEINSEADTYHYIRGYLNICMPPSIEAQISQGISTLSASANAKSNGATVSLKLTATPD